MPDQEQEPDGATAESLHLLTIFIEIDRLVADDNDARAHVASVLPAYREAGAFTDIDNALEALGITLPALDEALAWMAEHTPGNRSAARRMMAFAGLMRADSSFGSGNESVGNALRRFTNAGNDPNELVARLGDSLDVPNVNDWWRGVIVDAVERDLLDARFGLQAGAPPCSCIVSDREPGTGAHTLTTSFQVDLTLADVLDYLHPQNWPDCTDVWCVMREEVGFVAPPPHWFREEIGLDCAASRLVTYLDFSFNTTSVFAQASYELSPSQGAGASFALDIDEGAIVATALGAQTVVSTWKRLHFVGLYEPLNKSIVVWACLLGYGTVAEDMVFSCAAHKPGGARWKWKDHVTRVEGGKLALPDPPDTIAGCYEAMFRVFSSCVAECAHDYNKAMRRAEKGKYKADDLTQDMAKSWRRAERHMLAVYRAGMDPRRRGSP
jgi:hypothetical protein